MKKADLILAAVILAVALSIAGSRYVHQADGSVVVVAVNGEETARYSLHQNRKVNIRSDGGYNLLVIENGSACVQDADCPDRTCVHEGKIRRDGETIVCLPHKVVITVVSDEKSDVDGVSGR